ncbi:coiled-coil domain-containing protein 42 homolog [Prorops nasuta]|uniref:coiled-coil domain-containing protein 42 homolog n=1 Tax=Prorops nasuta TaxID=863751 RepID=UPI0034CD9B99
MNSTEMIPKNLVRRMILQNEGSLTALREYYVSKQEAKKIKKYPQWDELNKDPGFLLIKAQQELEKTTRELNERRDQEKIRRREMDERWDEIRKNQLLLRESFIKFNKFVKSNVDKRKRAEFKIREERKSQKELKKEIENLHNKLDRTREVLKKMKISVGDYKKYQDYMEKVANETENFQSINDIFNRYETLIDARKVLADRQNQLLRTLEETGTEMHLMGEMKSQMLMGLNNKLAELQGRHDAAKEDALKWEGIVARSKSLVSEKNLELIRVRMCCWNIYQQMCRRKGIAMKINRDDIEQQLLFIKLTIRDLVKITKFVDERIEQNDENYYFQEKSICI